MLRCPKCGCWRMSGPIYRDDQLRGESLMYTCNQCGYSEHTPTMDSKEPNYPIAGVNTNDLKA